MANTLVLVLAALVVGFGAGRVKSLAYFNKNTTSV